MLGQSYVAMLYALISNAILLWWRLIPFEYNPCESKILKNWEIVLHVETNVGLLSSSLYAF